MAKETILAQKSKISQLWVCISNEKDNGVAVTKVRATPKVQIIEIMIKLISAFMVNGTSFNQL
jgi:hypothetical protein